MTSFQKIAGGIFLAARAGRGGGLLLLPFFLVLFGACWMLSAVGTLLIRGIGGLVTAAMQANAAERGR